MNVPADFWQIARRGTEKAQKELPNYNIEFYIPGEMSAAAQKRILEDLLAKGVAGVSISPVNPDNSTDILNQVASKAALFTQDADAPKSNRAHVYRHGQRRRRTAGRRADEEGAPERRQGDAVRRHHGRRECARALQGIKEAIAGTKIEIVDVRTDGGDQTKAKANVEDTLTKYPNIDLLVGLWAYNTPQIYNAVKAAGKDGKVKIVGFDEDQQTLKGISEGVIEGNGGAAAIRIRLPVHDLPRQVHRGRQVRSSPRTS